jgi:signal peptidase II
MQAAGGASLTGEGERRADTKNRHRRVGALLAVALVVLIADVVSKVLVVARLTSHAPVHVIDGVLQLNLTRNAGAAFGVGTGATVLFSLVAVGVVVVIARTAAQLRSLPWAICLGLLLGGAIGNLVDRMLRSPGPFRGHVVDWIELPHWPVFNLADSAIVCGGLVAVLLSGLGMGIDGRRRDSHDAA